MCSSALVVWRPDMAVHAGPSPYPAPESHPPNHNPTHAIATKFPIHKTAETLVITSSAQLSSLLLPGEAAAGTAAMETLLSPSTLLSPLRGSKKKPASPAASASSSSSSPARSVVSCALRRQQPPPQAVAAWRGDGGRGGGVGSWATFLQHGLARRRCRWQSAWRRRPRRPWRRSSTC